MFCDDSYSPYSIISMYQGHEFLECPFLTATLPCVSMRLCSVFHGSRLHLVSILQCVLESHVWEWKSTTFGLTEAPSVPKNGLGTFYLSVYPRSREVDRSLVTLSLVVFLLTRVYVLPCPPRSTVHTSYSSCFRKVRWTNSCAGRVGVGEWRGYYGRHKKSNVVFNGDKTNIR